jgi:E3 ubiquitin-protein ligase RNF34
MPCENCNVQFTIFKRKQTCTECQRFYCPNCLKKSNNQVKRKNVCLKCEVFLQKPFPAKEAIMAMKTKDLVFYLQKNRICLPVGAVEKEDLANLIINHANHTYYESGTANSHSSTSTPDYEFQSFDQIKQTCQNLFTSISDKIASGKIETHDFH